VAFLVTRHPHRRETLEKVTPIWGRAGAAEYHRVKILNSQLVLQPQTLSHRRKQAIPTAAGRDVNFVGFSRHLTSWRFCVVQLHLTRFRRLAAKYMHPLWSGLFFDPENTLGFAGFAHAFKGFRFLGNRFKQRGRPEVTCGSM